MKKLLFFLTMILTLGITNVHAFEGNVASISIKEKSSTILVEEPIVANNSIDAKIVFKNVGDYVVFTLGLDIDTSLYTIDTVVDNNESEHIKTTYTINGNKVDMKLEYESALTTSMDLDDLTITINIKDVEGNTETIVVNPETGDNIIRYISILGISLLGLTGLLLLKKKKTILGLILLVAIFPTTALASESMKLNVEISKTEIKVGYDIVFNGGDDTTGNTETKLCYFGEECKLPVNEFEKENSNFLGWATVVGGEVVYLNEDEVTNLATGGEIELFPVWEDIPQPVSFSTDSWATISNAVKNNNTSVYNLGDTKEIDMGSFGTHILRIANKSTPSECLDEDFSQTACGFVIEFQDIITVYNMNETGTNVGGWPASTLHTYLNDSIFNSLPTDLQKYIITTRVVSSHGYSDSSNFVSEDKLYLLALSEVFAENVSSITPRWAYDTGIDSTRQLDNYASHNVIMNSSGYAMKKYNNTFTDWWVRTALAVTEINFQMIGSSGGTDTSPVATAEIGVSPAFRIG